MIGYKHESYSLFIRQLQSLLVMGVALELKSVIATNLIRVSYRCISCYFHFNIPFKQLYTSNKTESFNYKGGYRCMCIEAFKGRAGLCYRLCVIGNLKTVLALRN